MRGSIECSNQLDGPETAAAAAVKGVLPSPGTMIAVDGNFLRRCANAQTSAATSPTIEAHSAVSGSVCKDITAAKACACTCYTGIVDKWTGTRTDARTTH